MLAFDAGGYRKTDRHTTLREATNQTMPGEYTDVVTLSQGWATQRKPFSNGFLLHDDVLPAKQKAAQESVCTLYAAVF